ncbi:MAG TPA: hypothetical protein VHO84_00815 [Syntrophorhabdaceae bacterium]|nr:hypothetical protein [Syntrophorhabdaceae bacterium]
MQNSEDFVSILKMAMDDQGFRAALVSDLESALTKRNLWTLLKASEIDELKNIFETKNDQVLSNNLVCAYRGYQ